MVCNRCSRSRSSKSSSARARSAKAASPVTWTWRPSAGQWKSSATWGLASISRALRVHRAEVKSSASSSIRFRLTVRAEGCPPAPTVTKATEAGCGTPSAARLLDPALELPQWMRAVHASQRIRRIFIALACKIASSSRPAGEPGQR